MVINRIFQWLAVVLVSALASGCALTSSIVDHAFGFDLRYDGQDAAVLDYRYGKSKSPVRAADWAVKEGKEFYQTGVSGRMLRGDDLYVKWKNLPTGQIFEDHVDLRPLFPPDITDHIVYLMIRGPQLYIYLVSPDRRPANVQPIGPIDKYSHLLVTQIYPDKQT